MSTGQFIDYETLALEAMQEANRGLVRSVLTKVGASGLAGDHHFYVAFNTQAPGVIISKRLKEKYPQEMTIVLQHRFWDLEVTDERFSVKLTFDGIPERLVVPFKALKVFYDPSVPFGLQFEESEMAAAIAGRRAAVPSQGQDVASVAGDGAPAVGSDRPRPIRRPKPDKARDDANVTPLESVPAGPRTLVPVAAAPATAEPASVRATQTTKEPAAAGMASDAGEATPPADESATKVVDFSKFRNPKK